MSEEIERTLEKFLESVRDVTCFRERLKIYAPTCHRGCEDAVKKLVREISRIVGGCTVYYAEKYWVSEDGYVVNEPISVIELPHYCFILLCLVHAAICACI